MDTCTVLALILNDAEAIFDKSTVAAMFGVTAPLDHILTLQRDGETVLAIPWPDGLTLDEALFQWAGERTTERPWWA